MHYRQRIRDAVAERLTAAGTLAGTNVFTSRARPILEILQKRESVLSVYTAEETSDRDPDGHLLRRTVVISIEGAAGGGDDLDDHLDTMAEQVEAAIDTDPTLGTLLTDEMVLTATASEISAKGNMQVGAFRMDYECTYLSDRGVDAGLPPAPPPPTEVHINSYPTPEAYVSPLVPGARIEPPLDPSIWGTDADISPNDVDLSVVAPSRAPEPPKPSCSGDWAGDEP